MNKYLKVLVITVFSIYASYAQQDPHYTQYMYNTMSVNPAYVGSNDHTVITGLARFQWVGLEGAPNTQTLSYDTPLGYSGVGLGVNLTNDQLGPASEIYLDVNVSYTIRTSNEGNLAFGLKLGGRQLNVDWSKGLYDRPSDPNFANNIAKFLPTVGAGVYYYKPNWYVGAAVPNILKTKHFDGSTEKAKVSKERMHMFFIAGYVLDLAENIKFKPAILTKIVDGSPLSLDISANFLFNEKFTAGLAWRWDDSISALLGLQATDNLQIGFAYDLTTSNYHHYNSGTFEIMLRWDLFKQQILKSPRFF
ncbi:MAG: PorP/SprF family type IX secretion system membrane protein [Tenacibaculum sp.]